MEAGTPITGILTNEATTEDSAPSIPATTTKTSTLLDIISLSDKSKR